MTVSLFYYYILCSCQSKLICRYCVTMHFTTLHHQLSGTEETWAHLQPNNFTLCRLQGSLVQSLPLTPHVPVNTAIFALDQSSTCFALCPLSTHNSWPCFSSLLPYNKTTLYLPKFYPIYSAGQCGRRACCSNKGGKHANLLLAGLLGQK